MINPVINLVVNLAIKTATNLAIKLAINRVIVASGQTPNATDVVMVDVMAGVMVVGDSVIAISGVMAAA